MLPVARDLRRRAASCWAGPRPVDGNAGSCYNGLIPGKPQSQDRFQSAGSGSLVQYISGAPSQLGRGCHRGGHVPSLALTLGKETASGP